MSLPPTITRAGHPNKPSLLERFTAFCITPEAASLVTRCCIFFCCLIFGWIFGSVALAVLLA